MKETVAGDVSLARTEQLFSEADALLRRLLAADPDNWQGNLNIAILELKRFRFTNGAYVPRDGLVAIRRAIRLNGNDAGTFFFGVRLAAVMGEIDKDSALFNDCIDYARTAIELGHRFDVNDIKRDHPLNVLLNDERMQDVLRMPPSKVVPSAAERMIPPHAMVSDFGAEHRPPS